MPDIRLTDIVQGVDEDKLVIPDFQRGFKWQTPDIRKLLESLLLDFPIGAALLWRTQRAMLEFRRIELVEFADDDEQTETAESGQHDGLRTDETDFILDGQQRITSIYKIFPASLAPTETELDSRFKGLRYFLALDALGAPRRLNDLEREDFSEFADPDTVAAAIIEKRHPDLRKEYRQVTGERVPHRLSEGNILTICERRLWLPLTRAFLENKQSHLQRLRRVLDSRLRNQVDNYAGPHTRNELSDLVDEGLDRWADWFTSTFQATLNSKALTCIVLGNDKPEGLARIFETINSTGLTLSVFDLLVARLGSWEEDGSRANIRTIIHRDVDPELLQRYDDVRSLGGHASRQVPRMLALRTGIELKKGEILRAKKERFLDVVETAGPGLQCALSTLTVHMGIVDHSFLPFKDLIALVGASHSENWDTQKDKVIAFLWALCLVEDWDSSTNDKTRAAFKQLSDILAGKASSAPVKGSLEERFPAFDDLLDCTSKANLAFRTFMSFNLSRRGVDWSGTTRGPEVTHEDHHVFPRDWLANNRDPGEDKQLWSSLRDSVLNRIFVSKKANNAAKAKTPPNYLGDLTASERRILQIPESFLGPLEIPIKSQAYMAYLRERYELIKGDFLDYVNTNL